MAVDARSPSLDDDPLHGGRHARRGSLGAVTLPSPADFQRSAAAEVDWLVDLLEPTLDAHQRRLLHQLRLAAETLGAVRATAGLQNGPLR
jgi:hypothetical protein